MANGKLRLEIPVLLPRDAGACGRCVEASIANLKARGGVTEAHVKRGPSPDRGKLCIHFDPAQLSPSQVRAMARREGADVGDRYAHLTLRLAGPLHARAARILAERLRATSGVLYAEVAPTGFAVMEFDADVVSEDALRRLIDRGAEAIPPEKARDGHPHEPRGFFGEHTELAFAGLAGVALLVGWGLSLRGPGVPSLTFYGLAYVFGAFFTLREALGNLRRRRFEIDTLMLVAAAGAAALGQWAEGALLLVLFSLGHALEHFAMGRARRAIEALAELAPERATRKRAGQVEDVVVAELQLGDILLVRPNERLPADGLVVAGESSVNQAPVTGESVPVDKRPAPADAEFDRAAPEHRVFAGTINGAGALEVKVPRRAAESTLARVVRMVAEAEAQRSPTQRFTDRFERIFVPSVLVLVGVLMLAFVVLDEPFSVSFYRAIAVLVAASPCALAISVPSAVLSGVARAGRGGVLVKGGGPLENLGTLTALAFDKTGTLTEGKPKVTDVVPAIGATETELLGAAAAVEAQSDHPLAAAVVAAARERLGDAPLPLAEAVESLTGQGVRARVGGKDVHVGKPKLFDALEGGGLPEEIAAEAGRLEKQGRTVMVVRSGDRYLGVLGLLDTPREAAGEVIARLRGLGLRRIVMLSGDNQGVADAVAAKLGLDEAIGGLMPEDKVAFIKAMREKEGLVAMVGDGVNDAPAMANATVGIAMGAAGSDVALETADVALMADDLRHLPFAVGLSRQTSRIIRQNLWASLGMVALLIPATLFGLKIGAAVVFHEGSTLLVVANALRLLAYKPPATAGTAG
ncbi:MAG: heavy metal translocating P-type ATPase [Phenylobacterium sp.]|uniref:heavy metal translocating P-type ATPase n=1 Tax=Phenylobacterium sp. TaxID=1871053 RepID=UPI001228B083|nr:heavy metal translocating P-type ATPase [Phenylobacterium sp.]TAJ71816.1 MAG: heavy metal translocating P-type ATPase [Phenylobacterium sp.]